MEGSGLLAGHDQLAGIFASAIAWRRSHVCDRLLVGARVDSISGVSSLGCPDHSGAIELARWGLQQQFRADPSTLWRLILQPGQGFYVPMYQRDFTWGESEIGRLFEDIDFGLTRAAGGQTPSTFLGSVILVEDREGVVPKNVDALPAQVLQVVDGQQRLTTLLILFGVLTRALAERLGALEASLAATTGAQDPLIPWVANSLRTAMESLFDAISMDLYIGTKEYRRKPRLIRQSSDRWGNDPGSAKYESDIAWFLMEVIRNRENSQPTARVNPPASRPHLDQVVRQLEESVLDIAEGSTECEILNDLTFLTDKTTTEALVGTTPETIADPTSLDPDYKASLRLVTAAMFLLNGVLVIDVRAPDEDYAFALFEPLNTTGQLLTALETLKPLVVQAEGGSPNYATSPSGEDFARLERYFPPQIGAEDKSKLISDFLVSFALGETGKRLSRNLLDQRQYLRSEYRGLASASGEIVERRVFIHNLAECATFFFEVWRAEHPAFFASATDFDRVALEVLRSTNHSVVVPLLSRYYNRWAYSQNHADRGDFFEVLRAVTVFWTLWRTSRPTTRGIDDVHRRLMSAGLHNGVTIPALARRPASSTSSPLPTVAELKAALRSILSVRGQIACKEDWVSRLTVQPIYQTSRGLAKFVLLAAHEDSIDDPDDPGLIAAGVSGVFHCLRLDIWMAHYSIEHIAPQSPAAGDTSYEKKIYDQGLVDRLGNLTLMPSDLNSLVDNKNWIFKRDLYSILSRQSADERLNELQTSVPGLAQVTVQTVMSAQYLPFCRSLSNNAAPQFTADFITKRGERIADLAWDRLWTYLT
jgi:Protein of unknown function DUF262/Protein of unknown function (DUF1524)